MSSMEWGRVAPTKRFIERVESGDDVAGFAVHQMAKGSAGWHAGIVFRDESEGVGFRARALHVIDIGGAARAEERDPWEHGRAVRIDVDQRDRLFVNAAISRGRRAAPRIEKRARFSHLYLGGVFDEDGEYHPGDEAEVGLDCVSFLLALFEGVGFPLVDRATWPGFETPLDTERRQLVRDIADDEEKQGMREQAIWIQNQRAPVIHPCEVAASALFALPSVPYDLAHAGAARLSDHGEDPRAS